MTPLPTQHPELASNLSKMFGFLEEWYKMDLTPLCDIRADSRVRWCDLTNQAIEGLPGILLGDENPDTSCWLSVERLKPIQPPALPEVLYAWTKVIDDPGRTPELAEEISVLDEEATAALWEEYEERKKEIAQLPKDDPEKEKYLPTPENVMVVLLLENCPEVQQAWDGYFPEWESWSIEEAKRRKTIALYQDLFSYRQQLENGTAVNPQEMVWGVGMTYRSGPNRLRFPLLSIPVEFVGSTDSLTLKIAGLDRTPLCNIHAFLEEFPEGAAAFEKNIRAQFSPEREQASLTPFDTDRLRQILTVDAGQIDSGTTFAETRPEKAEGITFTLDWAVMIQTRSANYMLQDVQKLKTIAEKEEVLTSALDDIAIRRETPYPESQDVFRGFSHMETDPNFQGTVRSLYFPKSYNQEQVEVIRKLESSEGVVLQGPPGTGKTHTIANVISHYLATGKRVLVTSQKTPALKVLKSQLPDGIQMLTGLLLESDREGQEELESSVNRITTDILQLNSITLKKEVESLAEAIERSHADLQRNEKQTDILARRYRTAPPEHIGCDSPRHLAEEVAESAPHHTFFPDELDSERGWKETGIDGAFFDRLRAARKSVGEHIAVDPETILDPSELPTAEEFANLHKNLCSYSATRKELDELAQYPAKQYLRTEQREKAYETRCELEKQRDALAFSFKGGWQYLVSCCYHNAAGLPDHLEGVDHVFRESIDKCIEACRENDLEARKYALKPVVIPNENVTLIDLLPPITKSAEGQKPFGLVGRLSSRALNKALQAITIRGDAPASTEDWQDVKRWIELHLAGDQLAKDWNLLADSLSTPKLPTDTGVSIYSNFRPIVKQIEGIWSFDKNQLRELLTSADELLDLEQQTDHLLSQCLERPSILDNIIKSLGLLIGELDGRSASTERQRLLDLLDGNTNYLAHFGFLKSALGSPEEELSKLDEEWRSLLNQSALLHSKIPALREINILAQRLREAGARKLAASVTSVVYEQEIEESILPSNISDAWAWAMRKAYLKNIDAKSELLKLNIARLSQEKKLANDYEDLAVKRTWLKLKEIFAAKPNLVTALNQFVTHIKKIGKGTGKLAPFHRAEAQKSLSQANEAIRCWIMPQWRVSESLPAGYGLFDLVIIDEASQSDLKALPAIARGKKVLVVGDDKQVSPLQVGTKTDSVMALYHRFLKELPFGSSMTIKDSIYDLASIAYGAASIRLREHFRCTEPIINFSSKHFYDGEIRCLRVPKATERMSPALIDVYLEGGVRSGSNKTNEAEADYIVEEIINLTEDCNFGDRSIGIVTLLGNEQSRYIWDKIQSSLPEETILRHGIRCGDSSTFQGSEFDVVFLSMVDHVSKIATTKVSSEQRYNVAASRAKDRMYLCRSIPRDGLKPTDLRHKLISHFSDPGLKLAGKGREDCESPFEEEIFDFLSTEGYMVSTQIAAAGFRIDLVVEDAGGRRLAIECDGYIAHPEHKWSEDMSRQRTLERAGWSFHRIWGPSYYSDKESSKSELLQAIKAHGIEKHQDGLASAQGIVEFRHIPAPVDEEDLPLDDEDGEGNEDTPVSEDETTPLTEAVSDEIPPSNLRQGVLDNIIDKGTLFESAHPDPRPTLDDPAPSKERVEMGDTVSLQFHDSNNLLTVTIVRRESSQDGSLLNYKSPLAEAVLNQQVGSELVVNGRLFRIASLAKATSSIIRE
ncbi:AAA domain-containing protein [Roseibacillus persicicus]|uniref:AAA domain-containing protein n=1 Tax=Roseibacillus persicicus TaxID=454148 RepID=UPI00281051D9|nr:AAA domain-containing protein [Roseibacillus persicicus]MDQ8192442.1 AAA domain-containing protein [Roseibacillus persicicus]